MAVMHEELGIGLIDLGETHHLPFSNLNGPDRPGRDRSA